MTHETATGLVFLGYMVGVFGLAILSNRLLQSKSFMAEYFLGSRGLGVWALAFTFAATSASGGSFTGYPSLVYTYGWVVAIWIASYMIVPPVTMGLLGKRLNQVARRAGAITIPDVIRERFASPGLGLFASGVIVFFTLTNLIAQFKAGGIILNVLLEGTPGYRDSIVPWVEGTGLLSPLLAIAGSDTGYVIGLLLFSFTVVVYTAYGGFRAVVWTDVMQGIVMGIGVLLLIPFTMAAVGGLGKATREIAERPPRLVVGLVTQDNALEYRGKARADVMVEHRLAPAEGPAIDAPAVDVSEDDQGRILLSVTLPRGEGDQPGASAGEVIEAVEASPEAMRWVSVEVPELERYPNLAGAGPAPLTEYPNHLRPGSDLVFGPGLKQRGSGAGDPFHPIGMAISFFFMWAISGAGQPGTMVRLMAFKDSKTLRYALFTVTVYFGCIYLPIVFLFTAAQQVIHPAELTAGSDQIMPQLASRVAPWWLAGILIAAPFAAVMSTVDSFLLLISSAVVRDIYQRSINPDLSEKSVKIISYSTTAISGVLVTFMALNPPRFLQDFIVMTGAGFAATFLAPIALGIYWKRMTRIGAWLAMAGGFLTTVVLFAPVMLGRPLAAMGVSWRTEEINLFGLHPLLWGLIASFGLGIIGSLVGPRPPEALIRRYFSRPDRAGLDAKQTAG
jgi:Na+/pantothenate symporter